MSDRNLKQIKQKKGFTLVELIVVVAIIAVLASILVPLMVNYLDMAVVSRNQSGAKTIKNVVSAELTMQATQTSVPPAALALCISLSNQENADNITVSVADGGDLNSYFPGLINADNSINMTHNLAAALANAGQGSACVYIQNGFPISCIFTQDVETDPSSATETIAEGLAACFTNSKIDSSKLSGNKVAITSNPANNCIVGIA